MQSPILFLHKSVSLIFWFEEDTHHVTIEANVGYELVWVVGETPLVASEDNPVHPVFELGAR